MRRPDWLLITGLVATVFTALFVAGRYAPFTAMAAPQVVIGPGGGSGSGGPTITQGLWSALPATCAVNNLYLVTDNIFLSNSRCSSTNTWSQFVAGALVTSMASSMTLTSSLQGGTTVSNTHGYEAMTVPAGQTANDYSYRYWAAPSTPYTQYIYFRYPARFDNSMYQTTGIGFSNGTHLFGIECGSELDGTSSYDCRSFNWTGNTYGTFPQSFALFPPLNGAYVVWGIGNDGTSLHLGLSTDGGNSFLDVLSPTTCVAAGFTNCAAVTSHFYGSWNSTASLGTPVILIAIK